MSNLGTSPWAQILRTYPNSDGNIPTSAMYYGLSVFDQYSRGLELTPSDIQGIIADQIVNRRLPQDAVGIYVVLASADVSSPATGFCVPSAQPPYHGLGEALGTEFRYAFVGNPARCPSVAAPQFVSNGTQLPTPNGSLAGDGMVNTLAHVLSTTITNPRGTGWFDRYGFQNADKCDEFGTTYVTPNGARANMKLGQRDYLIQENWVNERKGYCALTPSVVQ